MQVRIHRTAHGAVALTLLLLVVAALALPSAALAAYLPWTAQKSGTTQPLYAVSFPSDTAGWVAGGGGTVLRTTDGGATWKAQASKTTQTLHGVTFTDTQNGWAVGNRGTIVHTANGGATWAAQVSGTTQTLYGVAFANAATGWAVGGRGTVLGTTDGGATWTAQTLSRDTLTGVACADASTLWVTGGKGIVRRSTNGGTSWTTQYPGGKSAFNAVGCTGTTAVWVAGSGGSVRKSANGGGSWSSLNTGTSQTLYALAAVDGSRVRAAGAGGAVRVTVNAGSSWAGEATGTTQSLSGLAWRGTHGWVVGGGGVVLTYAPDTAAPTTAAAGLQADDHSGWANAAVTVTLTPTDAGSAGVAATHYTVDGVQKAYTAPFSVSGQGRHTVTYWSVDGAGNTESAKTGYVNIDLAVPTVGSDADAAWHTADVTVHLSAADTGGSGVAATQYREHGSSDWVTANGDQFVVPATSTQGPHTFDIRSLDAAGNASATGSCTVKIDATAPTTTATGLGADDLSDWSATARTVTFAATDGAGSGVSAVRYTINDGPTLTYTKSFTISDLDQTKVTYWSVDAIGNTEAVHTGWVNISDPYAQSDGLAADLDSQWHNGAVSVRLIAHGNPGPLTIHYTLDGGAQQDASSPAAFDVSGAGHHTIVFWASNGNVPADESPHQTGYVNIDTTRPQTTMQVGAPQGWVNHAVTLLFQAGDDSSGVATTYSAIDNGTAAEGTSREVPAPADHSGDGPHTVTYWSADAAGNVETPTPVAVNIDTRQPTTKAPYSLAARRGQTAKLRYVVADQAPCAGTAAAKIVIKNARGKAVKTLKVKRVKTGVTATVKFRCKLAKGKYRFFVYATDAAGNAQSKIASNRVTVR